MLITPRGAESRASVYRPMLRLPRTPLSRIRHTVDHHARTAGSRCNVYRPGIVADEKARARDERDQLGDRWRGGHRCNSGEFAANVLRDCRVAGAEIHHACDAARFAQPARHRRKSRYRPAHSRQAGARLKHGVVLPRLNSADGQNPSSRFDCRELRQDLCAGNWAARKPGGIELRNAVFHCVDEWRPIKFSGVGNSRVI